MKLARKVRNEKGNISPYGEGSKVKFKVKGQRNNPKNSFFSPHKYLIAISKDPLSGFTSYLPQGYLMMSR